MFGYKLLRINKYIKLRSKINCQAITMLTLEDENEKLKQKVSNLEKDLEETKKYNKNCRLVIEDLETKVDKLHAEKLAVMDEIANLKDAKRKKKVINVNYVNGKDIDVPGKKYDKDKYIGEFMT